MTLSQCLGFVYNTYYIMMDFSLKLKYAKAFTLIRAWAEAHVRARQRRRRHVPWAELTVTQVGVWAYTLGSL